MNAKRPKRKAFPVIVSIAFIVGAASCSPDDGGTLPAGVERRAKDPTHKVVCACTCAQGKDSPLLNDTKETHDVPAGGCGSLNGTKCEGGFGKLEGCTKESVPAAEKIMRPDAPLKDVKER